MSEKLFSISQCELDRLEEVRLALHDVATDNPQVQLAIGHLTSKLWPIIHKKRQSQQSATESREKLALWMIENGFATGHGDTIDDLLGELSLDIQSAAEAMRERCFKVCDVLEDRFAYIAAEANDVSEQFKAADWAYGARECKNEIRALPAEDE